MKHYTIRVYGKVQGVFFRKHTKEKADELGVKGTVRNEEDGSVSIQAEGSSSALADFLIWLNDGPQRAEVQSIDIKESGNKSFSSFDVIK